MPTLIVISVLKLLIVNEILLELFFFDLKLSINGRAIFSFPLSVSIFFHSLSSYLLAIVFDLSVFQFVLSMHVNSLQYL